MQEVELPNGQVLEFPDDMSDAQITYTLRNMTIEPEYSPVEGMGTVERLRAGAGKAFMDTYRGAQQLVGMEPEIDRQLDQPLMETPAGLTGNILGSIAQMPVPAASIPKAAAVGSAYMGLQPAEDLRERGTAAAMGGLLGAGGQLAGNFIGRAVRPVRGQEPAAGVLAREGIPLSAADQTGSRVLHNIEETVGQIPGATGAQQAFKEAQQAAYNQAVLSRAGINAPAATDDVMDAAYNAMSREYGQHIGPRLVDLGDDWWQGLYKMDDINRKLPPSLRSGKITNLIDDMLELADTAVPADRLQAMRSAMSEMERTLAKTGRKPDLRKIIRTNINMMDDAVESSLPDAQAAAMRDLRKRYAVMKTIEPAIDEAGNIFPSRLNTAIRSRDKTAYVRGMGELTELAKAGKQILPSKLPQSGTAERALIQSMLMGGGGGGAIGLLSGDPSNALEYAAYGAALPAATANLARRAMFSETGERWLTQGIPGLTNLPQGLLGAGNVALRGGPVAITSHKRNQQ